jgi:hypothetical protein
LPADKLAGLRRLSGRRSRVDAEWRAAIQDARADGESLRAIAAAAGVSHVAVLKIVRGHARAP